MLGQIGARQSNQAGIESGHERARERGASIGANRTKLGLKGCR